MIPLYFVSKVNEKIHTFVLTDIKEVFKRLRHIFFFTYFVSIIFYLMAMITFKLLLRTENYNPPVRHSLE